jgi:hypothetical protein
MFRRTFLALAAFAAFAAPISVAQTQDALAFAAISPDGANVAMVRVAGDKKVVIIAPTVGDARPKAIDVSDRDVRALHWAGNGHVITSFETPNPEAREAKFVDPAARDTAPPKVLRAAFSLNVATMKSVQLLGARNAALGRTSRLDRILTTLNDTEVLMAAPVRDDDVLFEGIREAQRTTTANERPIIRAALSIWKVNLDTGVGVPQTRGEPATRAWFVSAAGAPLARIDRDGDGPAEIWSYIGGGPRRVFSAPNNVGLFAQGRQGQGPVLIVSGRFDGAASRSARALDPATGALGPDLTAPEADVFNAIIGRDGSVLGVLTRPGGAVWLDPGMAALQKALNGLSPGATITLHEANDDRTKAIVKVTRAGAAQWFLFDVTTNKAELLGPDITRTDPMD